MKIPKYIENLLRQGVDAAYKVTAIDWEVHRWMKSKGIDPNDLSNDNFLQTDDISILTEPYAHAKAIQKWIEEH